MTQRPILKVCLFASCSLGTQKLEESLAVTTQAVLAPTTSEDSSASSLHKRGISPLQRQMDDTVSGSSAGERDSEHPSSAFTQANHKGQDDTELDDDQFLVESLLGKRVRRIRRRKVVRYPIKWKGYPEGVKTPGQTRRTYTKTLSETTRAEVSRHREDTSSRPSVEDICSSVFSNRTRVL